MTNQDIIIVKLGNKKSLENALSLFKDKITKNKLG